MFTIMRQLFRIELDCVFDPALKICVHSAFLHLSLIGVEYLIKRYEFGLPLTYTDNTNRLVFI